MTTSIPKPRLSSPEFYLPFILLALLAMGLGLRLFDLTDQPIDFHPTRQLRGAIIARGMYYEMSPSAEDTIRQQAVAFWQSTGQYEPSILERLVAISYLLIGEERFWIARIVNGIFWIVGGAALFALTHRMSVSSLVQGAEPKAKTIAFVSSLFALAYYLILPFGVQASRSFQPDPGMVMWIILASYTLYRWSEDQAWKWSISTGILAGMAVLTKAVALYIVGGAMAVVILYTYGIFRRKLTLKPWIKMLSSPQVWVMAALMVAPTAIYYLGRGDRTAEFFNAWTVSLSHLLLDPWFYARWMNLVQRLLGFVTLILALVGILIVQPRSRALLLGMWGGYFAYGLFLPYQMYSHTYYHLQTIPLAALSMTPVIQVVLTRLYHSKKIWRYVLAGLTLVGFAWMAWVSIKPLYGQDHRNEPAYWQEIASHLPSDGKIVALTQDYGYRLMYYGWRKVTLWPNSGEQYLNRLRGNEKGFQEYFDKHTKGKRYFLVTAFRQFDNQPTLQNTLYDNYPILAERPGYIIFDLSQPKIRNSGSD